MASLFPAALDDFSGGPRSRITDAIESLQRTVGAIRTHTHRFTAHEIRNENGSPMGTTGASGNMKFDTWNNSTGGFALISHSGAATKVEAFALTYQLPEHYVAHTDLTFRVRAKYTQGGADAPLHKGGLTGVYLINRDGTGTMINDTNASDNEINTTTSLTDLEHSVPGSLLRPGDWLQIFYDITVTGDALNTSTISCIELDLQIGDRP